MNIKFGLACLLLVATVAVVTADQCDFSVSPLNPPYWAGERTAAMACMEAVSANITEITSTLAAVRRVFQGYSFSDLVRANVAPYSINVDWAASLDTIESIPYISDFHFQSQLSELFNSLVDAHLVYFKPLGYLQMRYYFPFSIVSRYEGGQQKFFAAPGPVNEVTWDAICGCSSNLQSYYGSEITQIDNTPLTAWLTLFAKDAGYYADTGVQMNNILMALQRGFTLGFYKAPSSDSITYQFNGTTTATFKYHFQYSAQPTSVADVEDYNHYISPGSRSRSDDRSEADGFGQDSIAQAEQAAIEHLENVIRSKRSSRDSTSLRLVNVAQRHAEAMKQTRAASAAFGVKLAEAVSKRDFNAERFLASHQVPLPMERLRVVDSAIVAAMDLEAGFDRETAYAETLRKIDSSIRAETAVGVSKKNTAAATETPLVTGDMQLFRVLYNYTNAGVGVYNDSIVLKLKGFDLDGNGDFLVALRQAHNLRSTYNTQQLIIDVSGNGGGIVCLNYVSLSFLVEQWRNHSTHGSDVLYSPYDWRLSPMNDVLWNQGKTDLFIEVNPMFDPMVDPTTGVALGDSVHDDPRSITYGSHTSNYSKLFNWDLCPNDYFEPDTVAQMRAFEKIIILTDGTCGSSCAYFLSHLRSTNKVRVVSYGGSDGLPLATSSFAGGNVYGYDYIVKTARAGGYAGAANLTYMDTNAVTTFNFRANYHSENPTLPRQFIREEADWHVSYWDPLNKDVYVVPDPLLPLPATDFQIMANLYASVTPLFADMPANLSRIDLPPPPPSAPSATPTTTPVETGSASAISPLFAASVLLALLLAIIF